ncbi:LPS export ABC transporter periplasmic protein LptC [bacterium]|nr:LPS export ABC transporter periplasmic protein LptC [bacterium]
MLCMLCIFAGCRQAPPAVRLAAITGHDEPTMLFEGFRMVSTKLQTIEWEFVARSAQIFEKINLAKAQDVKVVYWRQEKIMSTLTAERGVIETGTNNMRAEKNVVMVSHEGIRLYTDQLYWDHEHEKIYTDLPVRVVRETSVLTGVGLRSDSELKHIEVLSDVNIQIESVKDLENAVKEKNTGE